MIKSLLSFLFLLLACLPFGLKAQSGSDHSVARIWNEELLDAIRNDFARPTVHSRNLYHLSMAMYDCYAAYDDDMETVLMGKTLGNYTAPLDNFTVQGDLASARNMAISYAAYKVLRYRFRQSPNRARTWARIDSVMQSLGYNPMFIGTDYQAGNPAALGNHVGTQVIFYGNTDGSNDAADYANRVYQPSNPPMTVNSFGNPDVIDIDRWQPLRLATFIDQSGNVIPGSQQGFLGAEWGGVVPFALSNDDKKILSRDTTSWTVYHDPGMPPRMKDLETREEFQRQNEMVAIWSGLLDPDDPTMIDISPGATGKYVNPIPEAANYFDYYNEYGGGDYVGGLDVNPVTGQPYAPNVVKRGDYVRVLAEFWADGPRSETPPGHWFSIMNGVMDDPLYVYRWRGQGPVLPRLEYDLKAYLTLGGAVHDAAVSAWGIKGFYDCSRPVTALRYMAEKGQRSDPNLPNYDPEGLRIEPGFIEMIESINDPLAGASGEHIGEMKFFAWRAHDAISDPSSEFAGAGWIRAKEWWPYQLRTFVSPPFGGYISGHSTFSRASAEILTAITGSEYFPGGLGTFSFTRNEYLHFENGPSDDMELTWATYRGASDEVSLSRIFGGIHAPLDDIPGRRIGIEIAEDAFAKANSLFDTRAPELVNSIASDTALFSVRGTADRLSFELSFSEAIDTNSFSWSWPNDFDASALRVLSAYFTPAGTYQVEVEAVSPAYKYNNVYVNLLGKDLYGNPLVQQRSPALFNFSLGTSGVEEVAPGVLVTLYPNPASTYFALAVNGGEVAGDLLLRDLAGRQIKSWAFQTSQQHFDINSIPAGVYSVTLISGNGSSNTWRLVKP